MKTAIVVGTILGSVGSALDFTIGFLILAGSTASSGLGTMSATYSVSGLAWTIGLFALGGLLLVSSIYGLTRGAMRRMGMFGILMIAYGVIMLVVGGAMYLQLAPMMNGYLLSAISMLIIGLLMIANGALMMRSVAEKRVM